jgi:Flagellar basal body rod FlgEFG protein C-terminal
MTLSRRFAETADKVAKASTLDFGAQRAVGTTMERQPSAPPEIQSDSLSPSEADRESGIDLVQEMVRLHTTETNYVANLRVVATKDELLGTVLDIFAWPPLPGSFLFLAQNPPPVQSVEKTYRSPL